MIYRFDILSISGLYEGWAHTPDEMRDKYAEQYPDDPPPYVFLSGEAPKVLDFHSYKRAVESGLSKEQIQVVDQYLLIEV